jgi:hypothetical protein
MPPEQWNQEVYKFRCIVRCCTITFRRSALMEVHNGP